MTEKQFTPAEKMTILRRHFIGKVTIRDLCHEYGIQPDDFYEWQDRLFEWGALAFREYRQPARFVTSKTSNVIHRTTCRWADNIALENREEFDSIDIDLISQYSLCGTCFIVENPSKND